MVYRSNYLAIATGWIKSRKDGKSLPFITAPVIKGCFSPDLS